MLGQGKEKYLIWILYLDEYALKQSIFNNRNIETIKTRGHILYRE